jgi:small subunit ribosomal protein S18
MARRFKKDTPQYFDYKDVKTLQRFVNMYGQIEPATKTGLNNKQQKRLSTAVKRARHLALMPFVATN